MKNTGTSVNTQELISDLLGCPELRARRRQLEPSAVLYQPSERARHLYLVETGQLRCFRRDGADGNTSSRLLEILGPGDWCGECAFVPESSYGEQVIVVEHSSVLEIAGEPLVDVLCAHPELAREFLRRMAGKLMLARTDAADLAMQDCGQRVVRALVRFSQSAAASPHPDGIALRMTHQQLAEAVGAARETVSLALTNLRQKKLLRTRRNQMLFNPDELRVAGLRSSSGESAE